MSKKFTEEEDEIIRKNVGSGIVEVCRLLPERSESSIRGRIVKLGLIVDKDWKEAEINILIKNYPKIGIKCSPLLPGRNYRDVKIKAEELGLRVCGDWSDEEDYILYKHDLIFSKELENEIPNKSRNAIRTRITALRNADAERVQYPLNLYMAINGTHKGFDKEYVEFEYQIRRINSIHFVGTEMRLLIRDTLRLSFEEGRNTFYIAKELGITPNQVKQLLSRGIGFYKSMLIGRG